MVNSQTPQKSRSNLNYVSFESSHNNPSPMKAPLFHFKTVIDTNKVQDKADIK